MPQFLLFSHLPTASGRTPAHSLDPGAHPAAQARWRVFNHPPNGGRVRIRNPVLKQTTEVKSVRSTDGGIQVSNGSPADIRRFAGYRPSQAMDGADALTWAAQQPTGAYRCIEVRPGWN